MAWPRSPHIPHSQAAKGRKVPFSNTGKPIQDTTLIIAQPKDVCNTMDLFPSQAILGATYSKETFVRYSQSSCTTPFRSPFRLQSYSTSFSFELVEVSLRLHRHQRSLFLPCQCGALVAGISSYYQVQTLVYVLFGSCALLWRGLGCESEIWHGVAAVRRSAKRNHCGLFTSSSRTATLEATMREMGYPLSSSSQTLPIELILTSTIQEVSH